MAGTKSSSIVDLDDAVDRLAFGFALAVRPQPLGRATAPARGR